MTEVPEYLLRRSRERREALGLGSGAGGSDTPPPAGEALTSGEAPAAPAVPPAAAEAPTVVEPAAPVAPTSLAPAAPRSGIPVWMLPVLAILPFWAFVYVYALEPQESAVALTPIELGAEVYGANSASCHGDNGEGVGEFPPLEGEVIATFPNEADHVRWVQEGSLTKPVGAVYGDPARAGGAHTVQQQAMPSFIGILTPEELNAVVLYERETFK